MNLADLQAKISEAIFTRKAYDAELKIQGGEKAFAIYRNNIFVSLINTLRNLYPQTASLCGEDFNDKAREFIESHAPSQPHLLYYGEAFPDFISAGYPMLKIVAMYERQCNLSYGADRGEVLTAEAFLQYDEDMFLDLDVRLSQGCFIMQPMAFILAKALCEESITQDILAKAKDKRKSSSILITRHDNAVLSLPISLEEADFLRETSQGKFASALLEFIDKCETAETRLGEFFALSVFRLN